MGHSMSEIIFPWRYLLPLISYSEDLKKKKQDADKIANVSMFQNFLGYLSKVGEHLFVFVHKPWMICLHH